MAAKLALVFAVAAVATVAAAPAGLAPNLRRQKKDNVDGCSAVLVALGRRASGEGGQPLDPIVDEFKGVPVTQRELACLGWAQDAIRLIDRILLAAKWKYGREGFLSRDTLASAVKWRQAMQALMPEGYPQLYSEEAADLADEDAADGIEGADEMPVAALLAADLF